MCFEYTGRMWTVTLPPGTPLLNMNDRRNHMGHYAANKQVLQVAQWMIRQERIPHIGRAHILYYLSQPDNRRRDPANWMSTAKACVDALVKEGVLDDDDSRHVIGPDPRIIPGQAGPLTFSLRIRELE